MKILVLMILVPALLWASPRMEVKRGNRAAARGDAAAAMTHFKRALEQGGDSSIVMYNMGNLLYGEQQYPGAAEAFVRALKVRDKDTVQAATLYNLGNSLFQQQQYEQAITAYIESLKRTPRDEQAKYNLELARRMLRQQPPPPQQQPQSSQEEKRDSTQQQSTSPQPDQNQEPQDQPPEQQSQPQPQQAREQQMTAEEAERILNALLQDEQNTLRDVKKVKVKERPKREKDW